MSEGRAVTVPVDPAEDSGIMLPANRAFSEEDTHEHVIRYGKRVEAEPMNVAILNGKMVNQNNVKA